jgi:ribonuclease BN (tRNA processing enzyme)
MRPNLHPRLVNGRFGDPGLFARQPRRDSRAGSGRRLFFLESCFAAADRVQAQAHLITIAALEIARAAGVRRLEPFHFPPRYEGDEARMLAEVEAAFTARSAAR